MYQDFWCQADTYVEDFNMHFAAWVMITEAPNAFLAYVLGKTKAHRNP